MIMVIMQQIHEHMVIVLVSLQVIQMQQVVQHMMLDMMEQDLAVKAKECNDVTMSLKSEESAHWESVREHWDTRQLLRQAER